MKTEKNIQLLLSDETFCNYVFKRCREEVSKLMLNNKYLDPIFEELDMGFSDSDDYVVPLVDYLKYKLHYAKVLKNKRKREKIIWWVLTQLEYEGFYTQVFAEHFNPLVQETGETVVMMLHEEYVKQQMQKE